MQPRSLVTQEWSVHAEVVFSHAGDGSRPVDGAPAGDVRMEYSWRDRDGASRPSYGFQRGNIVFTSTPPPPPPPPGGHVVYGTLPLRRGVAQQQQQPYNRRCKSTCSIVLTDARQQSRCGDRGCYHSEVTGCEVCGGGRSPTSARRANTFTTHFCTRLPEKPANTRQQQDASSQTDFVEPKFLRVPEIDNTSKKLGKRLSRSPARLRGKSPLLQKNKSQCSDSRRSSLEPEDSLRKPRTVHIDVYCTGSDASVSSEAETTEESSPQTVYESEQYRVVHAKTGRERLPRAFRKCESFKQARVRVANPGKGYDSDDGLSSHYPSKLTSYDSLSKEAAGSSWSTVSSALTQPDDETRSLSTTTWKDTVTDLALSRSSLLDSVDLNLAQSDSFEYADTSDRLRIREKERAWGEGDKTWRSPDTERKFLMRHRKQNSFLSTDTEEDDDDTGDAWSFVSHKVPLRRESTVRRFGDAGSLSDSGASSLHRFAHSTFGGQPPSKVESSVTAPFATVPTKAQRFGAIVETLRKPGHHVGPSKNPDCSCVHCRKFYEDRFQRGRARSVGEVPSQGCVNNVRDFVREIEHLNKNTVDVDTDSEDAGTPV